MRAPHLLAITFAAAWMTVPATARAQDPTDSVPAVEVPDSSDQADDDWSPDDSTEVREHRPRRPGEPNPYLREVKDRHSYPRRGPVWLSVSIGGGGEAVAVPGSQSPYTDSRLAPTLSLGGGATVGQQLRLGVNGFVWFNLPDGGTLETVSAAMLTGQLYPIRSSGLFLKSGVGLGHYGLDDIDCDCGAIVSDYGLAWMVGGGFEAPVGRGIWIGPTLELYRFNVGGPDGYRERVVNFGISITFDHKD